MMRVGVVCKQNREERLGMTDDDDGSRDKD
jgi:hypothetical protein